MTSLFLPAALLAALAAAPAAASDDGTPHPDTPARLIAFDGADAVLETSKRLRIWRGEVSFRLEVDATGTPTNCKVTPKFRLTYTNDELCEVLIAHHSFEPARDASGAAVEGSYEGHINFMELREKS